MQEGFCLGGKNGAVVAYPRSTAARLLPPPSLPPDSVSPPTSTHKSHTPNHTHTRTGKMQRGDAEDPDEASALLAQAALFPPGSLQRRYTLHYWRHAGIDAQKEAQAQEEPPKEGQERHERPRGLHQYLYHHPNGLFIVGLGKASG